jgi:hypothetical protein
VSIFVSHSRKDTSLPEFEFLLRDLELMRRQVWLDQRLTGGQAWWDEILLQIRSCDLFIIALTRRSLKSQACRRELSYARDLGRPILPLRLADLSDWQLPEVLSRAQVADYSKRASRDNAGVTCAFALRDAVEKLTQVPAPTLPEPLPTPPEIPTSYVARLQPLIEASELPLAKQEEFLREVRLQLDDEDEDRKSLVEILQAFRSRPDIAFGVAVEIDALLEKLPSVVAHDPQESVPAESGPEDVPQATEWGDLSEQTKARFSEFVPPRQQRDKTNVTVLEAPGVDIVGLARNLQKWYETQKLEAQMHSDDGGVVVQCRGQTWARRVGAGAALTVRLSTNEDELSVEVGGAQWMDKLAAAGVSLFVVWPAAIPAALGGYKQAKLPTKTVEYINSIIPLYTRH